LSLEHLEDRTLLDATTLQLISAPAGAATGRMPGTTSGDGPSFNQSISADGRFVAYDSVTTNLVREQNTTTYSSNVFLYDRMTGVNTLVSHAYNSPTATGDGYSLAPVLSSDGNFVLFTSGASNLVAGTTLPFLSNVFVWSRATNASELVSHANGTPLRGGNNASEAQGLSGDGRFLLYISQATDLAAGQGSSGNSELVYDRTRHTSTLISATTATLSQTYFGEARAEAVISNDGSAIAYTNAANDRYGVPRANVFRYDVVHGGSSLVSHASGSTTVGGHGDSTAPLLSNDGSVVAFTSKADDLVAGQTTGQANPDGNNVFRSTAGTGVQLVSHALGQATTTVGGSTPVLSGGGTAIAFKSQGTNLVSGQTGGNGDISPMDHNDGAFSSNIFLWSFNGGAPVTSLVTGSRGSPTQATGSTPTPTQTTLSDQTTVAPLMGISDDGRFVAYQSQAADAVPGQGGPAGNDNVFVFDRLGGPTLVSGHNSSPTVTGMFSSVLPVISRQGNVVALESFATDLNADTAVTNGNSNIWVFDLTNRAAGSRLASHSALPTSAAGAASFVTSTSADGNVTVFESGATNLVSGQVDNNVSPDVFLFDKRMRQTTLLSHVPGSAVTTAAGASEQGVVSADGNFVAFVSNAPDLVPGLRATQSPSSFSGFTRNVFLYNRASRATTLVSHVPGNLLQEGNDNSFNPAISADGRYIAFVSQGTDLGGAAAGGGVTVNNVYLYDRLTQALTLVSHVSGSSTLSSGLVAGTPSLSDDGRFVAYSYGRGLSQAPVRLVAGQHTSAPFDVYLYDRTSGANALVSHVPGGPTLGGNDSSTNAVLSFDGSAVAFVSLASNLVSGQTANGASNVFLATVAGGAVSLVSGRGGTSGNGNSDSPAINQDGSFVAFRSDATNLVPGQVGGGSNVFEYGRQGGAITLVSHVAGAPLAATAGPSVSPSIDADGSLVAYLSRSTNLVLVAGQGGPVVDNVFVWDRLAGPGGTNYLASGHNGSPTVGGNNYSLPPLLSRHSFPDFSSTATDLVSGAVGTVNAFLNTILHVQVALTAVIPNGAAPGTVVGTFTITVNNGPPGQLRLPTVSLEPGGDGGAFRVTPVTTTAPAATLVLLVSANRAVKGSYSIVVDVDLGVGDTLINPFAIPVNPITVNPVATTTSLISSVNPSLVGQAVTFTAQVSAPAGAGVPAGSVTFLEGTTILTTVPLDPTGLAAFTTAALAAGAHPITAVYGGNPSFQASHSDVLTQTVRPATGPPVFSTTTALSSSADLSVVGQAVTFTAVVSAAAGGGTPAGSVTFLDGSTALTTVNLDSAGRATFTTSALPAGSHSVTAAYGGNPSYGQSNSNVLTETVRPAAGALRPADTVGTFDPDTGMWYLRNTNGPGSPDIQFPYGGAGWIPVLGDWASKGLSTVGVVDPTRLSNPAYLVWYLRNSNSPGGPDIPPFAFGLAGWIPVVGDWTGSGHTGIGVFDPGSGTWYLENNPGSGAVDFRFQYGLPGWKPVTGDWTGSGRTGIGVVDPSGIDFATRTADVFARWYLENTPGSGAVDIGPFPYGFFSWTPVTGDWDGNGTTTIAMVDPTKGTWYIRNSNSPGAPDITPFPYGGPGWVPVSGHYVAAAQPLRAAGTAGAPPADAQLGAAVAEALVRLMRRTDALDAVFSDAPL
jgi:Tol biopolymer transport system component